MFFRHKNRVTVNMLNKPEFSEKEVRNALSKASKSMKTTLDMNPLPSAKEACAAASRHRDAEDLALFERLKGKILEAISGGNLEVSVPWGEPPNWVFEELDKAGYSAYIKETVARFKLLHVEWGAPEYKARFLQGE